MKGSACGEQRAGQAQQAGGACCRIRQAGERGGGHDQGADHGAGDEDRLVFEKLREGQEVGEQHDGQAVARRAGFELLEGEKEHQQGDAGLLAEQGAVLQENAGRAGEGNEDQHPACRQWLAPPGQQGAPGEGRRR